MSRLWALIALSLSRYCVLVLPLHQIGFALRVLAGLPLE
jgi:hypothetical protein